MLAGVIDRLTDNELGVRLNESFDLAIKARRRIGPDGRGQGLAFLLDCGVSVLLAEWLKRGHSING